MRKDAPARLPGKRSPSSRPLTSKPETRKLRAQAFLAEAQAKEKAGELLSKELVIRQAQYIFINLRQAILNFATRYARHVLGSERRAPRSEAPAHKAAHEFLSELASFPEKIINPNWLESLEKDVIGDEHEQIVFRPSSGQEIRAEQQKAARCRKQKTATMRKLRARG